MRAEPTPGKYQVHFVAVQTENDRGRWTNLTNFRGRDWVESVAWGESVDSPVGYASVTLRKAIEGESISPSVREDLFGPGRRIRISVAVGQPDPADPGSVAQNLTLAWIPGFLGKIDDIEVVHDTIQIRARDMGAYIQDAVFEYDRVYGEAGGIPADVVMQAMLDDIFGVGALKLHVQNHPTLFVEPEYDADGAPLPNVRRGTSVLQAIRDLAMQAGLDVRYRWTNQGYELVLYKPPRVLSTVHVEFGPDQWADAPNLSIGDSEVRNVIEVAWIDPELQYERSVKVYNDESMRKFMARRYLLLSGEATRYIANAEQAAKMAEAALADLSFPAATRAVRVLLCPGIELGDAVALHGNGTDIAETVTGAVTAYEHNFSTGTGWTTIWLRDAPAGARVEWLRRGTSGGTVPILPSSIR